MQDNRARVGHETNRMPRPPSCARPSAICSNPICVPRVQRGADWMRRGIDPNASGAEPEIAAGMQRLEKEVNDAQQALGATPQQGNDSQQGLETALNRVERLRNQMDSLSRDGQGRQQGQQQGRGQGQGQQGGQQGGQASSGPVGGPGARPRWWNLRGEATTTRIPAADASAACTTIMIQAITRPAEALQYSPINSPIPPPARFTMTACGT